MNRCSRPRIEECDAPHAHVRATGRRLRRLTVLTLALALLFPAAAQAHSVSNTPSSNFHGHVIAIKPSSTSFRFEVIEATARVELRWLTGPEIDVPGYDGEPYLRVGPDGVFQNQASNATYLNKDRQGATAIPAGTGADVAPIWKKISSERVARWHDHRVHWMGATTPVSIDPNRSGPQIVQKWTIPISQGNRTFTIDGRLDWQRGPSPWPWLGVAVAIGAAVVAVTTRQRRTLATWRRNVAVLALLTGVLVAIDMTHLLAITAGVHGSGLIARTLTVGYVSVAAWLVALVAARLLRRRRIDGLYLLAFATVLIGFTGGLADLDALSKSATAAALPAGAVRALVVATLALSFGIGIAVIVLVNTWNHHHEATRPADEDDDTINTSPRATTPDVPQ